MAGRVAEKCARFVNSPSSYKKGFMALSSGRWVRGPFALQCSRIYLRLIESIARVRGTVFVEVSCAGKCQQYASHRTWKDECLGRCFCRAYETLASFDLRRLQVNEKHRDVIAVGHRSGNMMIAVTSALQRGRYALFHRLRARLVCMTA